MIRKNGLHWDAEVEEAEIAKLFQMEDSNQKLQPEERVRAAFQAFTLEHYEKDVTELINGLCLCTPKNFHCWIECLVQNKSNLVLEAFSSFFYLLSGQVG